MVEYLILALQAVILWSIWRHRQPVEIRESAEELEARRVAAEAQRLYEQGFVNLMQYDGSPGRERERV